MKRLAERRFLPPGIILHLSAAREFERGLRRGVIQFAHSRGPWTLYQETSSYLECFDSRTRLAAMRRWKAQGVIATREGLAEVMPLGLPTVVVTDVRMDRVVCQVLCDNEAAGRLGARSLRELGLQHFAYCGLEGTGFSEIRRAAFEKALRESAYSVRTCHLPGRGAARNWHGEEQRLIQWLTSLPKPTGLMACNDDVACVVAELCQQARIRVPHDIAILGVDNDEQVCLAVTPPLSSIAWNTEQSGYTAAVALDCILAGRRPPHQTILVQPVRVVERESTLTIGDPAVIRALSFIRLNANRAVQVSELMAVAGLSRRALQERFQKMLGRSPMQELHHHRVQEIARLLVHTDLTIRSIAAATGFDLDSHVSRFFARRTGMTPLAYRDKYRAARGTLARIPANSGNEGANGLLAATLRGAGQVTGEVEQPSVDTYAERTT